MIVTNGTVGAGQRQKEINFSDIKWRPTSQMMYDVNGAVVYLTATIPLQSSIEYHSWFRKYTISYSAFINICLSTQILSIQNISHSSWQLRPPHCFDHEVVTRSMYRWLSSFSSRRRIYIFLYVKKIEELKTILHIKY